MFSVTASRDAAFRQAIVFCCDYAYLPYAALAIERIQASSTFRRYDICLCSDSAFLLLPASLSHLNVRLCRIELGDAFLGCGLNSGRITETCLRFALPAAFAQDYDRILYLDADIYIQGGDFGALLAADIGSHAVAAARSSNQTRSFWQGIASSAFGIPAREEFDPGVLLIDVARFNAVPILEQCIREQRKDSWKRERSQKNILSRALGNDWFRLRSEWNWQYAQDTQLASEMNGAKIIHFAGPVKPWQEFEGRFPNRIVRDYRNFTATHFSYAPRAAWSGPSPLRAMRENGGAKFDHGSGGVMRLRAA